MTYSKNVVKVIYQYTDEIETNWRRKCVRKGRLHCKTRVCKKQPELKEKKSRGSCTMTKHLPITRRL